MTLNGSASSDPNAPALTHRWFEDSVQLATGASPTLQLAEGEHVLRLVVTDPTGRTDSDTVTVTIAANQPGENRLGNPGFESANLADWTLPSGASVTTVPAEVHSGTRAIKVEPTTVARELVQRVVVTPGTSYVASGWVRTAGLSPVWATLSARVITGGTTTTLPPFLRTRGNSPYAFASVSIPISPSISPR